MADPATIVTGLTAVSSFSAARGQAASQARQAANAEAEAKLAETQALQRDASARQDLSEFVGSIQSVRAGANLGLSPNAMRLIENANTTINRERMVRRADSRQRAQNMRQSAQGFRSSARASIVTGYARTAVPILQHYG